MGVEGAASSALTSVHDREDGVRVGWIGACYALMMAHHYHRKSIRLDGYDYSGAGAYFITILTKKRARLFGEIINGTMQMNKAGQAVSLIWKALPDRFDRVILSEFVVMPDHFHAILMLERCGDVAASMAAGDAAGCVQGEDQAVTSAVGNATGRVMLGGVMRTFKSTSAAMVNGYLGRTGPVWHRNYYEHIIRNEVELSCIRRYIRENPARWSRDRRRIISWVK